MTHHGWNTCSASVLVIALVITSRPKYDRIRIDYTLKFVFHTILLNHSFGTTKNTLPYFQLFFSSPSWLGGSRLLQPLFDLTISKISFSSIINIIKSAFFLSLPLVCLSVRLTWHKFLLRQCFLPDRQTVCRLSNGHA